MNKPIWAIVILVLAIGAILEMRYALIVDSPVVAKLDRLTGDVWIVNAGVWRKVQEPPKEQAESAKAVSQAKSTVK